MGVCIGTATSRVVPRLKAPAFGNGEKYGERYQSPHCPWRRGCGRNNRDGAASLMHATTRETPEVPLRGKIERADQ